MNYGYVKVAAAVPRVKVADCKFNASEIEKEILFRHFLLDRIFIGGSG